MDYDATWSIEDYNQKGGFRVFGNDSGVHLLFSTFNCSNSILRLGALLVNNKNIIHTPLTPQEQQDLQDTILSTYRSTVPFPKPVFEEIPDPAGPDWNVDLASKPDSAPYIQHLIDSQGIAYLSAGENTQHNIPNNSYSCKFRDLLYW
jgi:hypothetical protein